MTTAADLQIVPQGPASLPQLHAADEGVASSLESVLADNTRRVYQTQWRIFTGWCCQFSWSLGRRFSRTSSHPGSAVN